MTNLLLFSMPGGGEWLIILLVVVFIFGGKKIPELMRGIGKCVREFNAAKANLQDEFDKGMKEDEAKKLSENK